MPDQIIDIPGVGQVAFPDTMDDAAVSAAAATIYQQGQRDSKVAEHRRILVETPETPSMLNLAGTALGRAAKGIVTAPINILRTVGDVANSPEVRAMGPMALGPALMGRMVVNPAIEQGQKAIEAGREGRVSEAVGHGMAAALPVIGPAAAGIGERLGTGDPETMAEASGDLLAMAAAPTVTRLAGRGAAAVGRAAESGGRSAWLRAAKITEPVAKRTNAYRRTGSLPAGEQEIANTVLSRGRGALTRDNAAVLRAEQQAASQQIGEAVEGITSTVPATGILRAMANEVRKLRREHDPSAGSAASRYRQVRDEMSETVPQVQRDGPLMTTRAAQTAEEAAVEGFGQYQPIRITGRMRPRELSAREVENFNVAAGQRNSARYAQRGEPVSPGAARVDMAGSAAGRAMLRERSPELRQASDAYSQLKPASQAASKAVQRIGHHDPIGLTQAVLSTLGMPGLMAFLQKGGSLSRIGQGMYSTGRAAQGLGRAVSSTPNQTAVLLELLGQEP